MSELLEVVKEYKALGIDQQIDYDKFYLYSLITHSTAIEGSTVTEVENQLLFDEGITANNRPLLEQLMNLDLKAAYQKSILYARQHENISVSMLKQLSSLVMKNTGSEYSTALGTFSAANGDLRLLNVSAGFGGKSYLSFQKVPSYLETFCKFMNSRRLTLDIEDVEAIYKLSFDAHLQLVTIHPWVDGNGRMSRLLMNQIQFEYNVIPVKVMRDSKSEYIQALEQSRDAEDSTPFIDFMTRHHIENLRREIDEYKKSIDSCNFSK